MALVNHHLQCSYVPSTPLSWRREIKSKQLLGVFPKVQKTDDLLSKHRLCLCISVPFINGAKWKPDITISCCKTGIQESNEIMYDEPKMQNIEPPVTFEPNGTIAGSVAVHNLFRSWLTMLRVPLPDQVTEGILEGPFLKIVETEHKVPKSGRSEILKTVCNFLGSNATIKIPAMIFISMYTVVNLKYGIEVAKELTPLWIGGPLVMALYITMVKLIMSLYIFSFKESVNVLKKSPMAYDYVISGKFNEIIRVRLLAPVVNFWNLGYIEMSKRIRKDFEVWLVDEYLDYVESIWPSYCKLIRFLKRANFI